MKKSFLPMKRVLPPKGAILSFAAALLIVLLYHGTLCAQTKGAIPPKGGNHPFGAIPPKEFIAEGEYEALPAESAETAALRAAHNAKKLIIGKAVSYVKGEPRVSRLGLKDPEMRAAIAVVIDAAVVDKKTVKKKGSGGLPHSVLTRVRVKARITSDKLVKIIERARDKSFVKRYQLVEDAYVLSETGIAAAKDALSAAPAPEGNSDVTGKIKANERLFHAAESFEKGFRHDLAKEPDKAIAAYARAIDLSPDFAYAYNNRGLALSEKGRFGDAIRDFNKAIALKGDFAFAYNNRGLAYIDTAQYALAISDYNRAITLNPGDADTFNNRGIAWFNKKEFGKAIVDFDRAIELNPNGAFVYNNRGNAYRGLSMFDKAVADFNMAIELRPEMSAAYSNRGLARIYEKEFDAALSDFNRAIELDGNNADAYNSRGNTYKHKGLYDKAIEDYTKATALNPKHAIAYYNRANTYKEKGDFGKAAEDYSRHLLLTPDNVDAYAGRAHAYYKTGHVDRAVEDFKKACSMGDKTSCKNLKKLGKKQ